MEIFPSPSADKRRRRIVSTSPVITAARRKVVDEMEARIQTGMSLSLAIETLLHEADTYQLSDELVLAIHRARQRPGVIRISAQTLRNWFNQTNPHFEEDRWRIANFLSSAGFDDGTIAKLFSVTERTIRNWRARKNYVQ
ncbi:hypothetical protein RB623_06180 [Mesorhizobium sp. LHD-90]|uniref:hypothetical protein n=1 Tax=Mesorhizobium sp. LHD-90 TaxID=3071414 RepID=UPI0027E0A8BD|nr:hypothetical protein [Mesorhizobium sp. LHD-90]MDQ6433636.1 hypothetical protein [Mesorhizobium sp. LHD-90]